MKRHGAAPDRFHLALGAALHPAAVSRLVVFGFDADQHNGAWAQLRQRLTEEHGTTVYAIGNLQGVKATPAFRTPQTVLDAAACRPAEE